MARAGTCRLRSEKMRSTWIGSAPRIDQFGMKCKARLTCGFAPRDNRKRFMFEEATRRRCFASVCSRRACSPLVADKRRASSPATRFESAHKKGTGDVAGGGDLQRGDVSRPNQHQTSLILRRCNNCDFK